MSENDPKKTTPTKSSTESRDDGGNASVQEKFDEINERGYVGTTTDPTPDENYTFLGQAKGLPTPESDPKQAAKVAEHQRKLGAGEEVEGA